MSTPQPGARAFAEQLAFEQSTGYNLALQPLLIGAGAIELFDSAAATPETAAQLRNFVRREPAPQRIEEFGWRTSGGVASFSYEWAG